MVQLDLLRQYQRGETPDAGILGFLTNFMDLTLITMDFPAKHVFSFGGGLNKATNLVENVIFYLKTIAGKMAKDIFEVESLSHPAQINQIIADSMEIISEWHVRGFLPPVNLMKMEGDYTNYLLYSLEDPQARVQCMQNRIDILQCSKTVNIDLDKLTFELARQWTENTPNEVDRITELTTGKMPPQVVALIDMVALGFLEERKQIGFARPNATPKEKLTQILLMTAVRLARIVYFGQENQFRQVRSNPEAFRKLMELQKVVISWFVLGLLCPLQI